MKKHLPLILPCILAALVMWVMIKTAYVTGLHRGSKQIDTTYYSTDRVRKLTDSTDSVAQAEQDASVMATNMMLSTY
jgi:hypothetical protein